MKSPVRLTDGSQFLLSFADTELPVALDPASYPGDLLKGVDGRIYQSNGVDAWEYLITAADQIRTFDPGLEVTVGAGGDFASLQAALEDLTSYFNKNVLSETPATIRILAGTTITSNVLAIGQNLSFIRVISDDTVVPVDASAFTESPYKSAGDFNFPLFGIFNGQAPQILAQFQLTVPPPRPNGSMGLDLRASQYLDLPAGTPARGFDGFAVGVRLGATSTGRIDYLGVTNYSRGGFQVFGASSLYLNGGVPPPRSATGRYAISVWGSNAFSTMPDMRMVEGSDTADVPTDKYDLRVTAGSTLSLASATLGGANIPFNTLDPTGLGIIHRPPSDTDPDPD